VQELQAVQGFNPQRVRDLTSTIVAQLRLNSCTPLEILGVADTTFMTIATTLLEVAEPGPKREAVRKDLTDILDRMRRAVETAPTNTSGEVQ
jgi:hypothetical protein